MAANPLRTLTPIAVIKKATEDAGLTIPQIVEVSDVGRSSVYSAFNTLQANPKGTWPKLDICYRMLFKPLYFHPESASISKHGGSSTHLMENYGETAQVFKIQTTSTLYRVKPVFGLVQIGQSEQVVITRLDGPPGDAELLELYGTPRGAVSDRKQGFNTIATIRELKVPLGAI